MKDGLLVCTNKSSKIEKIDPNIFPELRYRTLKTYVVEWARKWPVIKRVRLFRYEPIFPQHPKLRNYTTKYALIFNISGNKKDKNNFIKATGYNRTIKDEYNDGIYYPEFMPKSFDNVYYSMPDRCQEEWLLLPKKRNQGTFRFENNPSWLLYDPKVEIDTTSLFMEGSNNNEMKNYKDDTIAIIKETIKQYNVGNTKNVKTVQDIGGKGGSQPKRNSVLEEALILLFKKESKRLYNSTTLLWKYFKNNHGESEPLRVTTGSLFFRIGLEETLVTESNQGKAREKIVTFRTFGRYVSEIKKLFR